MQPIFYVLCILVSTVGVSTSAAPHPEHSVQVLSTSSTCQPNKVLHEPGSPIVDCQTPEENNVQDVRKNSNLQDLVSSANSDVSEISVRPRALRSTEIKERSTKLKDNRSTKLKEKRKNVVLKAITQILEHKPRKTDQYNNKMKQNLNLHDIHSIAASELVKKALSNTRSKRHIKVNTRIDEINNGRDIVLESVRQLIKSEKMRRRFDMVNPPNSKFSKRQQLLWDRLRVKAAEELLLHPKLIPQRVTERIFDTLKLDLEMETPEPTLEPGLFNDFKRRIQKEFYMDEYERGRGREFISTLKPVVYENYK